MAEELIVVDVSELEPPLPLEAIARKLRDLKGDQKLKVIHRMFPCVLPDLMAKFHMKYKVLLQTDERVELLIERKDG